MGKGQKNQTREQRSRLLTEKRDEVDELAAKNAERIVFLKSEYGIDVNPLSRLGAQVDALIGWVAPTMYARARFDYDVERYMEDAMSDANMGIVLEQRATLEREMEAAAAGRTETGLYVPEKAAGPAVVIGAKGDIGVIGPPPK